MIPSAWYTAQTTKRPSNFAVVDPNMVLSDDVETSGYTVSIRNAFRDGTKTRVAAGRLLMEPFALVNQAIDVPLPRLATRGSRKSHDDK